MVLYNTIINASGEQENIPMTPEQEAETLAAWAAADAKQAVDAIKDKIIALESSITPRRTQEAILGNTDAIAFITDIRLQIEELRKTLK